MPRTFVSREARQAPDFASVPQISVDAQSSTRLHPLLKLLQRGSSAAFRLLPPAPAPAPSPAWTSLLHVRASCHPPLRPLWTALALQPANCCRHPELTSGWKDAVWLQSCPAGRVQFWPQEPAGLPAGRLWLWHRCTQPEPDWPAASRLKSVCLSVHLFIYIFTCRPACLSVYFINTFYCHFQVTCGRSWETTAWSPSRMVPVRLVSLPVPWRTTNYRPALNLQQRPPSLSGENRARTGSRVALDAWRSTTALAASILWATQRTCWDTSRPPAPPLSR